MPARIMDGRKLSQEIKSRLKDELTRNSDVEPKLATIIVGDSPGSRAYLKSKQAACEEVGIYSQNTELEANSSQEELESTIKKLNQDESVTGILLQLPLPKGLNPVSALAKISPEKDVDGLNPSNLGRLSQKTARLVPCTPMAVVVMLRYYHVEIAGRHVVIINRSNIVGRPLSQLLLNEDATVTICHSKTRELEGICRQADVLITAIGRRSEFVVTERMIKPGAAVVDVGLTFSGGKVMGDVDFESALRVCSYLSPVPGGVGAVTTAMLLYNTLVAASLQKGLTVVFDPLGLRSTEPA